MKIKERILWISLVFVLLCVSAFSIQRAKAISEESEKYLQIFHEVIAFIETDYVEKVDEKSLYTGAIRGVISSLGDPHSRFLNEEEFKELQNETRGSFGGLGIEVSYSNGSLFVITPIDDTPASKAGIQPQDRIVEINGKPTEKMGLTDAIKMMRGQVGTPISLKIIRKNLHNPISLTLTRELIKIDYLKSQFLEKEKIGYIRLSQFMGKESTTKEFETIMDEFVDKRKAKGIILDLRNNPGGLLDLAVEMSDYFLKPNLDIVSVKGRGGELVKVFRSKSTGKKYTEIPLAILINNGSASAAEILAGAVQDNKRGKILGNQSFGKGSVQNIYPLPHKTGVAITIQKYYTPSGVSIHGKGISPDVVVNQLTPADDDRFYMDKVFKEGILKKFITENPDYNVENIKKFQNILKQKKYNVSDKISRLLLKREIGIGKKAPLVDLEFDPQLKKAIELISSN
ncbi:MAG: S41 family peptidase [Leptospiraceae bacterium]|nr:S41 family peptidase [Leptospiraceae bacterium]